MSQRLPRQVVMLGIVSLCMDSSSELIHSLLPVFLVGVIGASPAVLGLIEGLAEATASVLRIVSGTLSDRLRRRKPLLLAGYGLAALSKPLFPLADSAMTVLLARVADRIGKGLRGAPRDALVSDVTPDAQRGAVYGLRQGLDTIGAVLGPLLALVAMRLLAGDTRTVLSMAVVPAILALLVLARVEEPPHAARAHASTQLHLGLAQGATSALIADHPPAELRGTAFGLMHGLGGVATLVASGIAGVLWQSQGAAATFLTGAGFAALSLLLLPAVRRAR